MADEAQKTHVLQWTVLIRCVNARPEERTKATLTLISENMRIY